MNAVAREAVASKAKADLVRLERQIWIHWMASLSGDKVGLLQTAPIKDRLLKLRLMTLKRAPSNTTTV